MHYLVKAPSHKVLQATIHLPASKSIANRLLLIQALCDTAFHIDNLSVSDDVMLMQQAITQLKKANTDSVVTINVGHAGTVMRFLTALCALQNGKTFILKGSERMHQRPIKILVEALQKLGADIKYLNQEGFPPLKIKGAALQGTTIELDASVSSQYITALLLVAPTIKNGLKLILKGKQVSTSYITMTTTLMKEFGIEVCQKENELIVPEKKYTAKHYTIEADWSAASYWYSMAALANEAVIELPTLKKNSLQGDAVVAELYRGLGVETEYTPTGVVIRKITSVINSNETNIINCINSPDLAQTLAVTYAALNRPVVLTGLQTLVIKETNRIEALKRELQKFTTVLANENSITITPSIQKQSLPLVIETYNDHRMAMAFAPLTLVYNSIMIKNADVVNKSYPNFWHDLKSVGIIID